MLERRRFFGQGEGKITDKLIVIKINMLSEAPIGNLLQIDYDYSEKTCDGFLDGNLITNGSSVVSLGYHEIRIVMNTDTILEGSDLFNFFSTPPNMAQGGLLSNTVCRYELYNIDGGNTNINCNGFLSAVNQENQPTAYMYNCKCTQSFGFGFAGYYTEVILEDCIFNNEFFNLCQDNTVLPRIKLLNCEIHTQAFVLGVLATNTFPDVDLSSSVVYASSFSVRIPCKLPRVLGATQINLNWESHFSDHVYDLRSVDFSTVTSLYVGYSGNTTIYINGPAPYATIDDSYQSGTIVVYYTGDLSNMIASAPSNGTFIPG